MADGPYIGRHRCWYGSAADCLIFREMIFTNSAKSDSNCG